MHIKRIVFCLLLSLFLSSCTTIPRSQDLSKDLPSVEKLLKEAETYAGRKNWQKAFMMYSEALSEVENVKLYGEIQLKTAYSLYMMKQYPAALAALAPLPELPATLLDCKKLALASGILHKMNGAPKYVEALLEVALDNSIEASGVIPFKAAAYAELGRIYAEHGKNLRAVKCFEYAAELYDMLGEKEQASACHNIAEYLE
ncbi:MAG TPA: hypothetical protein DDZ11_02650 [Lentisphaeria bacterium]|nr:hypothetical protein [Lentisphaeria bacterium]